MSLNTEFIAYEPFPRRAPDRRRVFVIYAVRPAGSRYRAGALEFTGPDGAAFLEMWTRSGGRIGSREDLGLPPVQPYTGR